MTREQQHQHYLINSTHNVHATRNRNVIAISFKILLSHALARTARMVIGQIGMNDCPVS